MSTAKQLRSRQRNAGRPPKPSGKLKDNHLSIWLDDEQIELVRRAAEVDDDKPNNWGRRMVLKAARETLGIDQRPDGKNSG